jgi:hypothetical protein
MGNDWLAAVTRIVASQSAKLKATPAAAGAQTVSGASASHESGESGLTLELKRSGVRSGELSVAMVPMLLQECEINTAKQQRCSRWIWNDGQYDVSYNDNTVMKVIVDRWTSEDVLLRMLADDQPEGLSVTFVGHPHGADGLAGDVIWEWPGKWPDSPFGAGVSKLTWTAMFPARDRPAYRGCAAGNPAQANVDEASRESQASLAAGDIASNTCWIRLGALQGNPDFQLMFAQSLLMGSGVPQDSRQAFEWAQKAARQGSEDAQLMLAHMYADAVGVNRDPAKSQYWRDQQQLHHRTAFAEVLARARVQDEETQMDAIHACEQDPESALEFPAECGAAYRMHIKLLRTNFYNLNNAIEACAEERRLTKQVSSECVSVDLRVMAQKDVEAEGRANRERCKSYPRPLGCP